MKTDIEVGKIYKVNFYTEEVANCTVNNNVYMKNLNKCKVGNISGYIEKIHIARDRAYHGKLFLVTEILHKNSLYYTHIRGYVIDVAYSLIKNIMVDCLLQEIEIQQEELDVKEIAFWSKATGLPPKESEQICYESLASIKFYQDDVTNTKKEEILNPSNLVRKYGRGYAVDFYNTYAGLLFD